MIAHRRTREQITTYGNNDYGRWSWMRLNSNLGGIMVLSAYQVGNKLDFNNGKKGSKTARLQQHSMLQEANRTCTPREAFVQDLIKFLLPARGRRDLILIMGDFNKIFDTNAGMMDVADALGLVDLMEVKLKTQKFATHAQNESDERINYALGSPRMLLSIRQCGCEAFGCNYKGIYKGIIEDSS